MKYGKILLSQLKMELFPQFPKKDFKITHMKFR